MNARKNNEYARQKKKKRKVTAHPTLTRGKPRQGRQVGIGGIKKDPRLSKHPASD